MFFKLGSSNHGQRTNIDHGVEDHENVLDGDVWVNNHLFTSRQNLDGWLVLGDLVGNQRGNVGLDTTSTNTDNNNGHNVTGQRGGVTSNGGNGRNEQNKDSTNVNTTEDHNSLVFTKEGISNPGTKDWCNVTPELEKVGQGSCTLVLQVQDTMRHIIWSILHVVLEWS